MASRCREKSFLPCADVYCRRGNRAGLASLELAAINATRYYRLIKSFADADTEKVFDRDRVARFPDALRRVLLRKLLMLDAAEGLADLRVPPGNRLEKLKGKRAGQFSIRVNDRLRICFMWKGSDAYDVE